MKQIVLLLLFGFLVTPCVKAQELSLKKGKIIDAVPVRDSVTEDFAFYLPTTFDASKSWPLMVVFDMQGRGKQTLRLLKEVADKKGYIMASPNQVHDSLSVAKNILMTSRTLLTTASLFNIDKGRIYTVGFDHGGDFAAVVPSFIRGVEGVISIGATIGNPDLLSLKNPFHFIGIVGTSDYNYPDTRATKKLLNRLKFPNQIILFDGGHEWPKHTELYRALEYFDLAAMARENVVKDSTLIQTSLSNSLKEVDRRIAKKEFILADNLLEQLVDVYRVHLDNEPIKEKRTLLKKDKGFKARKRAENNVLFKESLLKEDYNFYLYEDAITYNYNNLGWWNYQMGEIKEFTESTQLGEKAMGKRLHGYVNNLAEENIKALQSEKPVDEEAVLFLWMLKTITNPDDYSYYLKVISKTAEHQDYGTAIFYVEELLKNGYTNKEELYNLEHTALLRITPEFNKVVAKYLKDARYDFIEE